MNEALIVCEHCSRSTAPKWEPMQAVDIDTRGLSFYRKATLLIRGTTFQKERRVEFSFSMDEELAKKIDGRLIADMIAREIGKQMKRRG